MDAIEELVCEREIRRLALDYADAFLVRDADLLRSLFAADAHGAALDELDAAWMERVVGRWNAFGPTLLHVTNHLVWVESSDAARGRAVCLAQMAREEGFLEQAIVYEDRYVVHSGRWRFATRRHVLWYGERRPNDPLEQVPAAWPRSQVGAGTLGDELAALAATGAAARARAARARGVAET
jgi:hypothetical protein